MKKILFLILITFLLTGCASHEESSISPERKDIIIALLDTGVSTTAIKSENLLPGWNYVTESDDTEDRINHGTAVTSVILGCESANIIGNAPDSKIVPIVVTDKVDGEQKSIKTETLAVAVRDSVDKYGASVINIGIGIKKDVPALKEAIEYVQKKGALVIAASGNSGSTELYYPAAYDGVVGVGSHDKNLNVSSFTQKNETVDILAPGEDIWLASRKGKTYGAKGTSYSSSYVSAAASLIWENNPNFSAYDVMNTIFDNTTSVNGYLILNIPKFAEK